MKKYKTYQVQHMLACCQRFLDEEEQTTEEHGVHYTLGAAIGTIKHLQKCLKDYQKYEA
jgi:hypothetical protein